MNNEHNKSGMYIFLFAISFVFLFFIYIAFIQPHPSPDHQATKAGSTEAAVSPEAAAPVTETADTAPEWEATPARVTKGESLFQVNCSVCHGPKGLGDGPGGQALNPRPRNFAEGGWKVGKGSPFDLFKVVTEGIPGTSMASFSHLPKEDRWAIVHYVRTLTQKSPEPAQAEIDAYREANK